MVSKRFEASILNKKDELKLGATWTATQVCLGTVKSGLGCHDAGVSGVDAVVETAST